MADRQMNNEAAFYVAKEMLLRPIDNYNEMIKFKYNMEVDYALKNNVPLPEIPELKPEPTIKEIIKLAKKINKFV